MAGDNDINVCCPFLAVLPCADTSEHAHLVCKGTLDNNVVVLNEIVKRLCMDNFDLCQMRPRGDGGKC